MRIYGESFSTAYPSKDITLREQTVFGPRIVRYGKTIRSRILYPEVQLISEIKQSDNASIYTNGLACCSAIGLGFLEQGTGSVALYLSHMPPGFEKVNAAALERALSMAESLGYALCYGAMIGSEDPVDIPFFKDLKDTVQTLTTPLSVEIQSYTDVTSWRMRCFNGQFAGEIC